MKSKQIYEETRERRDLDIVGSSEMQLRTNIERGLNKSILFFKIIVKGEMLGSESQLGFEDLTFVVVLKGDFELC